MKLRPRPDKLLKLCAHGLRKRYRRAKGECTFCGRPVGKGRQTWCGPACVEQYHELTDPTRQARKVWERDGGRCQLCGFDIGKLERILRHARYDNCGNRHDVNFIARLLFDSRNHSWEMDHVIPRVRGGLHTLENLRVLCIPCHKGETRRLAAERAAERRAAKQKSNPPNLFGPNI